MSLQITPDMKVLVKAPIGIPDSNVVDFVRSKKPWLEKNMTKAKENAKLLEEIGSFTEEDIKQIKKKARKEIPLRVAYYASKAGISYNRIFIRIQKSRWGSCSSEGNLNFNALLVLMPQQVMDSVIVHELCHRRHMDHSKAFYDEVYAMFPEYRKWNKWLREHGEAYLMRVKS